VTKYIFGNRYQTVRRHISDKRNLKNTSNVRITQLWDAFAQPLLQWKSNKYYIFWVCVCSLRYPACNAHAPYCHLWSAPLYNIFPHYLINETNKEKKSLNTKCVLIFKTVLFETFLIFKENCRHMINVCWFSCKVPPFLFNFNKNWIFWTWSKNTQTLNFMKIRLLGI
jgi:hypothetical protein